MAIKLRVANNEPIHLKVSGGDGAILHGRTGIPIYPDAYTGSYEVTPSAQEQMLDTAGLMMTANITVNPIPSNYGLITYNGSVITVS